MLIVTARMSIDVLVTCFQREDGTWECSTPNGRFRTFGKSEPEVRERMFAVLRRELGMEE